MNLDDLLGRLEGVRRAGDGYSARCPAHEDRSPSLSVTQGDDRILLFCHAECDTQAVVTAMGLTMADLFLAPKETRASEQPKPFVPPLSAGDVESRARALRGDPAAWRHVTEVLRIDPAVVESLRLGLYVNGRRWLTYPYRAEGEWLFANCRSIDGPRAFMRDPAKQRTVLFNGDTLEAGGTAIVTEGERDCAAALTLRLHAEVGGSAGAAVVAIPGADQARPDIVGALQGQSVVYVWTDADEKGEIAAKKIAGVVGPEKCRRVRLDGFKDLGDLLSAKGPDEARRVALEAVKRAPTMADAPPRIIPVRLSLEDIRHPPLEQFVLGRAFPFEKASVLFGPQGKGKSALAAQILFSFAAGAESLWGLALFPGGGPVLVYTAEDTLDDWKRKGGAVLCGGGVDMERALERFYIVDKTGGIARLSEVVTVRSGPPSESTSRRVPQPTEERKMLISAALAVGARIVFVETASRLVEDEDNAHFAALQSDLGSIGRETGAAVVVTHHATKAASKDNDSAIESARGGGSLIANARNALSLFPAEPSEAKPYLDRFPAEDLFTLSHGKATSSTRCHAPLVLARCDATWGAVFRPPGEVERTPEQDVAHNRRVEASRQREAAQLSRLYAVVANLLRLGPVSQSRLRGRETEIGVPKREREALILTAVEQGVLVAGAWPGGGRGVSLTLGKEPQRQPAEET